MDAFHANWTAPARTRAGFHPESYAVEDFEILTTTLSALVWRRWNGSIRLYTDALGASWYEHHGLLALWDRGIDVETLEHHGRDIQPASFWSAGKLLALARESAPCAMIDTDFIVWRPLSEMGLNGSGHAGVTLVHREDLSPEVYLPARHLKVAPDYRFDPAWDWNEPACNAAFVIFHDDGLRRGYVGEALRFMEGNRELALEAVSQAVFAEQRLLAMCAKSRGIRIHALLAPGADWDAQPYFTHVWGAKEELRRNEDERRKFCRACLDRLARDFPDWLPVVASIPSVARFG